MMTKHILLVILIFAMLVLPVLAADLPIGEGTVLPDKPIEIKKPPVVKYESVELFSDDLIEMVKQALGLSPKEQRIVVYRGSSILGIIPPESKFNGLPITEECLPFQYGTDRWYDCEIERAV